MLNKEQLADLSEQFPTLNENASGHLPHSDVHAALKVVGIDIPGYQLRELLNNYGDSKNLTFEQFNSLFEQLDNEKNAEASRWKKRIGSVTGAYQVQSTAVHGAEEIVHTIRVEEEVAFSNWINTSLSADPDLSNQLPVNPEGGDLYTKIQDGLIICKLINLAVPETIDTRCINKKNLNTYTKLENLTLCLMSAQAIGCNIVNIDADDLLKGKPHLILGLLWQIIRIGLFREIDLIHVPGLFRLLNEGETLDDFRKLSPEQILIRWVNYHLKNSGTDRRLSNFTSDVTDSEIYTYLINEIAPKEAGTTLKPLTLQGDVPRANALLREADKIGCREFVTAEDIAKGNYKLNLAFVANLFNKYPALPELDADEIPEIDGIEETPEEKTYRNWMNSLGVDPYVNYLYSDLQNGIVIFQLYDAIRPGIVNWKRVVRHFRKLQSMMDQIQNCNYAVELGKQLRFSLVGIQGKDIYDANPTLTLALVWQLMRAYTLTILAQCTQSGESLATDKEIVAWVNEKLQSAGKSGRIKSFQDPVISNAKVVIDLIDAISPGAINYELVQSSGPNASLENAKYAITSGRKLGAKIYATPEDIVEVRPKMVMTAFACLMARDAYLALNMRKMTNGNGN
ncbi:calponin homology (CH) domain-containing protein [Ditylenchus destructor]|uniref:Calponin homology (CH) domain-containing protein n=1 Tax=Ditylenchus destructor TaxID=166010 RepID=A0AAD4RCG9_9BILA|nr:calponin homology (CH) domain-containing protein [Ditylenchus destructor]